MMPAVAPGTKAASVGTSARSESAVGIITLNMQSSVPKVARGANSAIA
jgi:hypothetical protein